MTPSASNSSGPMMFCPPSPRVSDRYADARVVAARVRAMNAESSSSGMGAGMKDAGRRLQSPEQVREPGSAGVVDRPHLGVEDAPGRSPRAMACTSQMARCGHPVVDLQLGLPT